MRMLEEGLLIPVAPERKAVEELAYRLWELAGRPEGSDKVHWSLAEILLTEYVRVPPAQGPEKMQDAAWVKGGVRIWESMKTSTMPSMGLLVED